MPVSMQAGACACAHTGRPEDGIESLQAGITGICRACFMGAEI